jgi:hypothetical protein
MCVNFIPRHTYYEHSVLAKNWVWHPCWMTSWSLIILSSLKPMANFFPWIRLFMVLLWSLAWHTFMLLLLDDFAKSITPLVSSSLPILGPSNSSPHVTAVRMKRHHHDASKPSHNFLASCVLLLVRATQQQVHFWLVNKLSRLQPCLELCWFTHALLKPGLARRKMSFPYEMAREPNYNILSERMAYYSRYTTENKCVVLGFSMLQLSHIQTWSC